MTPTQWRFLIAVVVLVTGLQFVTDKTLIASLPLSATAITAIRWIMAGTLVLGLLIWIMFEVLHSTPLDKVQFVEELFFSETVGVQRINGERRRQLYIYGWSIPYDQKYTKGELQRAAICYATPGVMCDTPVPSDWPFPADWWKPDDQPIRNLAKAGALLAAAIDTHVGVKMNIQHLDLVSELRQMINKQLS